jgi:hypothetical protein
MPLNRGRENRPLLLTGLAAIPTASTAVTATPVKVQAIYLSNPTAGAVDVTIRDGGVAGTIVAVIAVPAKSIVAVPPASNGDGLMFTTGFSWNAASSGLFGEIIAGN